VIEAAATDEEVGAFWHALVDRFVDATAQRIEALQREGRTVVVEDSRASAFALCWMIERTLHQQLARGGPFDEDVLVDALTGIFMRAVYGERAAEQR
jgi:TetR/AcrR family transcriptional regulator, ethionamide resistance regulator